MVQLHQDAQELAAAGIQVVAVSYDSQEVLREFAEQAKIGFPLLSDAESKVIDAFGVRNRDARPGSRLDGIPHPGTFLIDANGVVRAKLFKEGYVARHTTDELLRAAQKPAP